MGTEGVWILTEMVSQPLVRHYSGLLIQAFNSPYLCREWFSLMSAAGSEDPHRVDRLGEWVSLMLREL